MLPAVTQAGPMRTPNPRMPEKGKRAAPGLPSRGRRREPADRSYPTLRAPEPRYSCACGLPGLLEAVGKHAIGHHDDENIVLDNEIRNSHINGVIFRPERGEGFTAKGNRVEQNRIIDSGGDAGIAVDVQGVTAGNTLARNVIKETRGPAERIGIQLGEEAGAMELLDNTIEGFATPIRDLRKA